MSGSESFTNRRGFLLGAMKVVPAAALLSGSQAVIAEAATTPEGYKPTYFNDEEWRFIIAAVDRLIPSNEDGPGALDLHVPEFIDRQMETDYGHGARWYLQGPYYPDSDFTLGYQMRYSPRELYRAAIPEVDDYCRKTHGKAFADLDGVAQGEMLAALQKGVAPLNSVKPNEFFLHLLANTKEGYFSDPMYGGNYKMGAWKMIGFPGARADFTDWMKTPGTPYPLGPVSILGEKA
ncbi:gluconate 2-dehydrogenase subunit 3 family protein [Rhizobium lusitanum]|uniref:Gluconate 2-dehydrogenase subunit 3 family protein n=1 Tax=Rhizobium lusitanum TaxID=293958 RepID=A0A6L9UDX7_9HYPH|nr:gluconate 2-dehydrogenase subunit 3 family protein [Rhizobium lusitanum]NEI72432.1 gluconate 2-dehydrogenase subunit 3 family protein [Rhizobium lusitanum]